MNSVKAVLLRNINEQAVRDKPWQKITRSIRKTSSILKSDNLLAKTANRNMEKNNPQPSKKNHQPSLAMFQAVIDALPFCIFWKDKESVGLGCNQALAEVAGLNSPEEYIGKTDYDLPWTKEEADFFIECDQRVIKSNQAELNIIESQMQADGHVAWLETSKIPLIGNDGEVIGILGAFHDITARKKAEDANVAHQKLETLATLSAGLAHDFNNILSMILGSSQLATMKIEKGGEAREVLKYLDRIEKATERASKLTGKFMSYSKQGEVTKTVFNNSEMIEDVISFMQPSIKSPLMHKTSDVNSLLYADINQLNQVLSNLIINASHASTHNEVIMVNVNCCNIELGNFLDLTPGSYIAISVIDKGIGMSEECQKSIFNSYFTTKENGNGLGLSSCLSIIENHNGSIQVESTLGVGSTFTVYLPVSIIDGHNAIHQTFSDEVIHGSGNIIYIEDDLNTQISMLEMLTTIGYKVKSYASLAPAMQYINEHPDSFDLVLTDYMLGDMETAGEAILNSVYKVRPDCPVILITGYFEQLKASMGNDSKFSYIVQKPVGIAQMSQIIARFN